MHDSRFLLLNSGRLELHAAITGVFEETTKEPIPVWVIHIIDVTLYRLQKITVLTSIKATHKITVNAFIHSNMKQSAIENAPKDTRKNQSVRCINQSCYSTDN